MSDMASLGHNELNTYCMHSYISGVIHQAMYMLYIKRETEKSGFTSGIPTSYHNFSIGYFSV